MLSVPLVLIIDGNNLLFKAYYATYNQRFFRDSQTDLAPTNAVYVFLRML
jgi:5'-3' exonuclease